MHVTHCDNGPARHAKERRIETNYSDDARCLFINGAQIRNTYEVTLRNMRQQIDRTIDIARLYILYVLGIHSSHMCSYRYLFVDVYYLQTNLWTVFLK